MDGQHVITRCLVAAASVLLAVATASGQIILLSPNGGETFKVGDTVHIQWSSDTTISQVQIEVSFDNGATLTSITRRGVMVGAPEWGSFPWVIPDSLDSMPVVSQECLVNMFKYGTRTIGDRSDAVFTIHPRDWQPPAPSKPKGGCGTGAGLAFVPPVFFWLIRRRGPMQQRHT